MGFMRAKVSYLCPTDAKLDDQRTLISLEWVYQQMQKCQADLKLVMVDACRNVPPELNATRDFTAEERKDSSRAFVQEAERLPEGILLLSSCSEGEFAREDVELGHGVFIHYLLEGLQGKADIDRNKAVTLNELFRFASKETKLHVSTKFSDSQRPKLNGNLTIEALDFEIVSPGSTKSLPEEMTNSIGMKLKLIPAGKFMMGSNESRGDLESAGFVLADGFDNSDEHPEHKVEITKPFYFGIHEVTRGQFGSFVADTKYEPEAEKDGRGGWGIDAAGGCAQKAEYNWQTNGLPQTDSHPVVNVSWNDAAAFCEWLSAKEGKQYRLPTEAEWEYSCKAGTRTYFSTGDGLASLKGSENLMGTSDKSKYPAHDDAKYQLFKFDDGWFYTMPVGRFKSKAFGMYDMHGNVSEWCSDWYDKEYYASSPQMDPVGATSGSFCVNRGGHWTSCAPDCRSAHRNWNHPSSCGFTTGFRLALSLSVKSPEALERSMERR